MSQDPKATRLEKITEQGEVFLASTDQTVIETAGLATEHSATFLYEAGEDTEQVTGTVISSYREGEELHFSVKPEVPGEHAI